MHKRIFIMTKNYNNIFSHPSGLFKQDYFQLNNIIYILRRVHDM